MSENPLFHGGPIFMGIDPAKPGSDFTVMMRKLDTGVYELLCLPPDVIVEKHSTAAEVLARMAAGERLLASLPRMAFKNTLRDWMRPMPRRRKWDQYGSYHRRQMKKWLNNPFRRR